MKFIVKDEKTGKDREATPEETKILIKQHDKAVKNCKNMSVLEKVRGLTGG